MSKRTKIIVTVFLILFTASTLSFALRAVCDEAYGGGHMCVGDCDCTGVGATNGPNDCQFACWDINGSFDYSCYSGCTPDGPEV